jgi:hypothetical protein
VLGEAGARRILRIPLSDDTACHRTADIAEDLHEQLIEKVRNKPLPFG